MNIKPLIALPSVTLPEKDKSFPYLSQFYPHKQLKDYYSQAKIDEITKQEKIYHDMILNSGQYNTTSLNAWTTYLNWTQKLISTEMGKTQDQLRHFMALENFTRSCIGDKQNYNKIEYISQWIRYVDMCADDIEVLHYMKKNEICSRHFLLYDSIGILSEKFHDFSKANAAYLEGLDRKVEKMEALVIKYKDFETRMENRINRELKGSTISPMVINDYLQGELKKQCAPVFNRNNKRTREEQSSLNCNVTVGRGRLEFLDDYPSGAELQATAHYGQVPIFVDEPFRKDIITKGTKLVEIYNIIFKFLVQNDPKFAMSNENFKQNLKEEYNKKPYSWISSKRIIPDSINNLVNSNEESKNPVHNLSTGKTVEDVYNSMIKDINSKLTNKEEIINEEGQKIRLVKVTGISDPSREVICKCQPYLLEARIKYYQQQEKIKNEKKSKRKTLIYKIDEDGDLCMSSDDEEPEENNLQHCPAIDSVYNPPEIKVVNKTNDNLNLFDQPMTLDEINQKMQEVLKNWNERKISIETRNLLFAHLEEKIIQIEKQKEIEQKHKAKKEIKTNNEIEDYLKPIKVKFHADTKSNDDKEHNRINEQNTQANLKPNNNKTTKVINATNNCTVPHFNPFPQFNNNRQESILKKPGDETLFSNVSRSLDFTNIKLYETGRKEENRPKKENKANFLNEEFSISFDSERSRIFQNPNESQNDQKISTPKHNTSKLINAFNIKDTPKLIKKSANPTNASTHATNNTARDFTDLNKIFSLEDEIKPHGENKKFLLGLFNLDHKTRTDEKSHLSDESSLSFGKFF